jgi:Spy/CpxP family protein refolding chaperone
MKKPMKLLLIAGVVSGVVATGLVHAMPGGERCMRGGHEMGKGHGRHGMDPEARIERMADALDLTQEQRSQMRGIVDKSRPQTREVRDRLRDSRKQLHALMQQDQAPEGEIRRLADSQGKAMADMIVLHTRVQADIRSLLTPEQRQKMQQRFGRQHGFPGMLQEPERQSDAGPADELGAGSGIPPAKRVSM